ncbi:hypothetical protein BDW22DRAFT_1482865 [Trametopsis cervina]|nr:hypothetical protein BDW22DRAFT_1482865 [Trametopsis cervina]
MADNNLIICFGPTEDTFLMCYGRLCAHKNAPAMLVNMLMEDEDCNPMRLGWISMQPDFSTGVFMSWVTGQVGWSDGLALELAGYVNPPDVANAVSYLTFADTDAGYFVRFRPGGGPDGRAWLLNVRPDYPDQISRLMSEVPDFTDALRYVLFGHGGTHIYVFRTGFVAHFEGAAKDPQHPLNQILTEFSKPGWTLQDGSTLSAHDDRWFALKFAHPDSQEVFMRFHLPASMHEQLMELVDMTNKPDESLVIQKYYQELTAEYENNALQLATAIPIVPQATEATNFAFMQQTTTTLMMW